MNALVIGGTGQVGGQVVRALRARGHRAEATGCSGPPPGFHRLDLRRPLDADRLIYSLRPGVVFLPAAFTHVDGAEERKDECHAVNVTAAARVARAVFVTGGRLVLFSTDHVFGDADHPRDEDEPPRPLNAYSLSKVAAEQAVRAILPDRHLIVRTSWVYGPDARRKNFVYRTVDTLAAGRELVVPVDQFGQPTYAPDLARCAVELAQRGETGTYHVVGPGAMSRLAFAKLVARMYLLDERLIRGAATAELGQAAPRPLRVRLDRTKAALTLGDDMVRGPRAGLHALRGELFAPGPVPTVASPIFPRHSA
jgi:dTDP-4-dehydrorhamnose reductase